jgi:hypothetical protein
MPLFLDLFLRDSHFGNVFHILHLIRLCENPPRTEPCLVLAAQASWSIGIFAAAKMAHRSSPHQRSWRGPRLATMRPSRRWGTHI